MISTTSSSSVAADYTYGHETETGGARKALGDVPDVGDDFDHVLETVLDLGVVGVGAKVADGTLESGELLLCPPHPVNVGHRTYGLTTLDAGAGFRGWCGK